MTDAASRAATQHGAASAPEIVEADAAPMNLHRQQ
jgi:hypothetical protein